MARIRNLLATALALYLALLPLLNQAATAQVTPEVGPRPIDPGRGRGGAGFQAQGATTRINGFNGFTARTTPGLFHHKRHAHTGGIAVFESPWGEEMRIRYWTSPGRVAIEFDGEVTVHHSFAADGTLEEIRAVTADGEVRTPIGRRAELAVLGELDPSTFDMSAYQLVEETLRAGHSEAFLDGVRQLDGPATASCGTQLVQCSVCILAWALSFVVIANACLVGGVVTWGISCLVAIVAHELNNLHCAATCIEAWEECDVDAKPGDPPDCDGPS